MTSKWDGMDGRVFLSLTLPHKQSQVSAEWSFGVARSRSLYTPTVFLEQWTHSFYNCVSFHPQLTNPSQNACYYFWSDRSVYLETPIRIIISYQWGYKAYQHIFVVYSAVSCHVTTPSQALGCWAIFLTAMSVGLQQHKDLQNVVGYFFT